MSEEEKIVVEEKNETKCFCQNKGFRKFLVIALGTFVGVYAALSIFFAIHRPPMMPPHAMYGRAPIAAPCPCYHKHHHFDKGFIKGDKGEYHKIKERKNIAPFDAERNNDKD